MKKNEKKTMEVVFILDRSGSMCGREQDTIGGFNSMLAKQKDQDVDVIWSTILFDDVCEVIHDRIPINEVKELTGKEYYVRGCTALLDAVGGAIHHTAMAHKYAKKGEVPDSTLFVITTDGLENASMKYSYRKVKSMVEKEEGKYGWEFIFLGANIDAAEEAGRIGIRADRSANYVNDCGGINVLYESMGNAMADLGNKGVIPEDALNKVRADFEKRGK